MNMVRNLNYANRKNPVWQKANNRANRYLKNLLVKEVLKMLPLLLVFKIRQYQKPVLAFIIAVFVLLLFALQSAYAQTRLGNASFINLKSIRLVLFVFSLKVKMHLDVRYETWKKKIIH